MRATARRVLIVTCAVIACAVLAMGPGNDAENFTTDFGLNGDSRLGPHEGNRYFSLRPGAFQRLRGEDDGEQVVVEITVLNEVRAIPFIANGELIIAIARVVEEREWVEGELFQVSLNYYACDEDTGNIYYLGEDVDHYRNGRVVSHRDSWLAGRRGAMPGLLIPSQFLIGARYQMEQAPGVSEDRGENVRMGFRYETRAGTFRNCIMVEETSPLEPDEETIKIYAPGVGMVVDDGLELVAYRR